MDKVRKVFDSEGEQVSLGFELFETPRQGDIIQNANGLKFKVEGVLHKSNKVGSVDNMHTINITISKALNK